LGSAIVAQGTSDAADLDFNLLLQALDRALGSMLLLLQEWLVNLEDPAKVAAVAQGFKALRELSDGERLADVTEVAWALENMLDRLVDGTLAVNGDFHKVATAAMNFLVTLSDKLSRISAGAAVSSFIDDYIYAEIIESADILASGGDLGLKSQEFEEEFPS
jgi:chemotaxis protein histidine kinase CheA